MEPTANPTIKKRPIFNPKYAESKASHRNPEKNPTHRPYVCPQEKAAKKTKIRMRLGAISLMDITGLRLICNATKIIKKNAITKVFIC